MGAWIRMNGSTGCMPDSVDAHETKHDAIESARQMFDDIDDEDYQTLHADLCTTGIHYFTDPSAGADYVSVEYDPSADPEDEES